MAFDTLEEAQAEILRLQGIQTELENERDTLSQNSNNLSAEVERLRTLNQNYFNRLQAQTTKQDTDEPEDVPSCEDFAKTLNI